MCGLAGSFGPIASSVERIARCHELMALRGPDGQDDWVGKTEYGDHLTFLHSRLSIIDLDERSNQPFQRENLTVTFNGEIYNYPELKEELIGLGHSFKTTSDTEVILVAYQTWGVSCVDHFEGMWAFVLFDAGANELILSRDRFGEKPLYYWWLDGSLYFGSEVRFLMGLAGQKDQVNELHLRRFLVNGYKSLFPSDQEFFEGIRAFPAGHTAVMTKPSSPNPKPYWSIGYNPQKMTAEEAR